MIKPLNRLIASKGMDGKAAYAIKTEKTPTIFSKKRTKLRLFIIRKMPVITGKIAVLKKSFSLFLTYTTIVNDLIKVSYIL